MSSLNEAFKIARHSSNKDFVDNPYVPTPTLVYPSRPNGVNGLVSTFPHNLTIARCFDIKYGSKNYFAPTYYKK